jgi:hypothetical protein
MAPLPAAGHVLCRRRTVASAKLLLLVAAHLLHAECPPRVIECTADELQSHPGLGPRLQDCGLFNGSRCCGTVNNPCPGRCSVRRLVVPASGLLGSGPGSCGAVHTREENPDELQHGESCSFSCADGYVAQGRQPRCIDGEIVSDVICQARACELTPPPHARLVTHVRDGTGRPPSDDYCEHFLPHGEHCTFNCEPGYHFIGSRTECMFGSPVQPHPGRCVPDACSGLNPPINGNMGGCPEDGTLTDGMSCELACADGFHMLVRKHPHCTDGELHADVECKDGPKYEEPIWGPLFLGLFFVMLIVLILYLGCTYIRARAKAVEMQPLASGYELENTGGAGFPSLLSRGSKPKPRDGHMTLAGPVWGGDNTWKADKP